MIRRSTHEKLIDDMRRANQREREAWLAERKDLLDRIMYLADRPWTLPEPTPEAPTPEPDPIAEHDFYVDEVV